MGWTLLHFKMGQFEMTQKCVIIDKLSTDLLLGTVALQNYGMIINYLNQTLSVGKVTVKIYTKSKQTCSSINATHKILIPARSTHVEWIKVPENFKSTMLVESVDMTNVYIKNGLFDANEGRIPLMITNKRDYPVEVPKGKFLAKVELINVVIEKSISAVVTKLMETGVSSQKISEIVKLNEKLTKEQEKKLKTLLDKYDHIFSKDKNDLGFYDKTKFHIDTGSEKPIKQRAYRLPYAQQENVDKLIE